MTNNLIKELVLNKDEKVYTTSLKIAEVFEKRHDNVIREIRNLIKDLKEIEESSYINEQNRGMPMFLLNRDGLLGASL